MEGRTQREMKMEKGLVGKLASEPEFIRDFFFYIGAKSPTTKNVYMNYIENFANYCKEEWQLKELKVKDFKRLNEKFMERYMYNLINGGEKKKGEAIVNANLCAVSKFCYFLIREGILDKNPCLGFDRPRVQEKKDFVYLEPEEIKSVYQAISKGIGMHDEMARQKKWKTRNLLLIFLPIYTGIRISAMLDMNVEDIDFENSEINVIEKRHKERIFSVEPELLEMINDWLRDRKKIIEQYGGEENALFVTIYGGKCQRMSPNGANAIIRRYTRGIPKNISAHKLRATMATTVYNATGDLYAVSCALGHEDTKTTKRYIDEQGRGQKKAAHAMGSILRDLSKTS